MERRAGKAEARSEVIWIDACQDALADVWHIRQVELRNHISGLHESAGGRAYGVAAAIHFHSRFIKRRVESRDRAARLVRRKVQLVAQAQVDGQLPGKLPVILKKEAVVSCAQNACVNAVSVGRVVGRTEQEVVEGLESYLAAPGVIPRKSSPVIDDRGARAKAVLAAGY